MNDVRPESKPFKANISVGMFVFALQAKNRSDYGALTSSMNGYPNFRPVKYFYVSIFYRHNYYVFAFP